MLDKVHQIIAHPVSAVVLAELGEGELEEEGQTLHQAHPPGGHGVQVLQHEEPDLAGSLHQEELEAGPGDDWRVVLTLVWAHQPGLQQSPHSVSRDAGLLCAGHHVVEDGVPPLRGVLVQELHVPGPGVWLQVGRHGPGLAAATEGQPQVGSEGSIEQPGLQPARHLGGAPEPQAGQSFLHQLAGGLVLGRHPGGHHGLGHGLLHEDQPHHDLLGQRRQLPEDGQAGGRVVVEAVQLVPLQALQIVVQVLTL